LLLVNWKVYKRHGSVSASQRRVVPYSGIKKGNSNERIIIIPLPLTFSVGELLDDNFESREMCIEDFQLQMLRI
jgi:hypothetical protein